VVVTAALLAGGAAGLGLILMVAGLRPAAPTLAARLAEFDPRPAGRHTSQAQTSQGQTGRGRGERVGGWLAVHGADRLLTGRVGADLAVVGRSPQAYLTGKAGGGLAGLVAPSLLAVALSAAGVGVPPLIPAWLSVCAAAVGFCLPDVRLRADAAARRRSARTALSAYLDLVAMRMASGAGLVDALADAAAVGGGWLFAAIRDALVDARTDGLSPAASLRRLGEELALADLTEIAIRLSLVEGSGAQAQASLQAQAASLRDRELTDTAGRAGERSQSMLVAQVVLALGFIVFLGYPAVAKVLAL
jgi:hypothetical protein